MAFTVTVNMARSPGSTMPTFGEIVNHVAPAVAVKEMGDPLVDSVMVCAADGLGGAANVSVAGFNVSVEGPAVTFNVTAITTGAVAPVTVTVTDEVYCATGRLVGFTLTISDAGRLPLFKLTFSQKSVPGVTAVKEGVPALARIETFCDLGSVAYPD